MFSAFTVQSKATHKNNKNLYANLKVFLSNIKQQHPLCSIAAGYFSAGCSKWWKNDIPNSTGL